jgi:hypothetical protein
MDLDDQAPPSMRTVNVISSERVCSTLFAIDSVATSTASSTTSSATNPSSVTRSQPRTVDALDGAEARRMLASADPPDPRLLA